MPELLKKHGQVVITEGEDYQAKQDAQTLAKAAEIAADPHRAMKAAEAAQALSKDQIDNAKALRKVAGKVMMGDPDDFVGED